MQTPPTPTTPKTKGYMATPTECDDAHGTHTVAFVAESPLPD